MKRKAFLVTFEGGDKCGKSTQIALLKKALQKNRIPVQALREPGGTAFGEKIREILLHRHDYHLSPFVEFQLFTAARRKLTEDVIRPFLKKGKGILILDRFFDSTWVYQGAAGKTDLKKYLAYEKDSRLGVVPDITFVLDIPLSEAEKRGASHKKDRMEKKSRGFHERVRQGYLSRARQNKKRMIIIQADRPIGALHAEIWKVIERRFHGV